jgi:hypothetical protein
LRIAYANTYGDAADTYCDSHSDSYAYAYADSRSYSNNYSHAYSYTNADAYTDTYPNINNVSLPGLRNKHKHRRDRARHYRHRQPLR